MQQGDPLGPLLFSLALQSLLASIKNNHGPNGLDLVFAYLDACVLAGSVSAVSEAFKELQLPAAFLGIKVAMGRDKSLLVPCAGDQTNITDGQFPSELCSQSDGNFELLGCPIGDDAFCRVHTTKRVAKACNLLKALGEVPDPAVALILLRHCASFGKLVFSTRLVPHTCHASALHEFDSAVFDCLESFLSVSLSPEDRKLASLSTSLGGLGLRQASRHCPGAYLASSLSSQTLCRKLDPAYALDFDTPTSDVSLATADYNSTVLAEDAFDPAGEPRRQQEFSKGVDQRCLHEIKAAAARNDPARREHLELTGAPRAGVWLHTCPSPSHQNNVDPLLFRTSILRWLRVPLLESDGICPLCDGVLDKFGDHCLVCPCGGDRTKRHNLLRNFVFHFAAAAGLNPELEKPGLLQPRPLEGPLPEDGIRPAAPDARRPADVYLPRWRCGTPLALDFAVTSGLRDIPASISDAASTVIKYEDFKRNHLSTERLCMEDGFAFAPIVAEACGGSWGPSATKILIELAKTKSLFSGESQDVVQTQLFQSLGVILHRENARAVVKRIFPSDSFSQDLLHAASTLQAPEAEAGTE